MKVSAWATRTSLSRRTWNRRMPRAYFPAHTRRNAIRSRCAGSMFAWILNTKPASAASPGATVRSRALRGSGPGAWRGEGARGSSPARVCAARQRPGSVAGEGREQLLDAEVVDGGAEEHRRLPAGQVGVALEAMRGARRQPHLLAAGARLIAEEVARRAAAQAVDGAVF